MTEQPPDRKEIPQTRLPRNLLILGIVLVPLAFAPNFFLEPYNVPKLLVTAVVLAVVATVFGLQPEHAGRRLASNPLIVPILLVGIPATVSWTVSPFREIGLVGKYGNFLGLIPLWLIPLFALAVAFYFVRSPHRILQGLVISGTCVALYGLVQAMGLDPVELTYQGVSSTGVTSTLGNTNFLGGFMAIVFPVTFLFWDAPSWKRYAGMASTCTVALALILSFSQGAWAAALGGASTMILLSKTPRERLGRWLAAASTLLIGTALVGSVVLINLGISVPTAGGGSTERAMFWNSAIAMAAERPLVGWGPDAYHLRVGRHLSVENFIAYPYRLPEDPHSVPLAITANAGILGLLGLAGVVAWTVSKIRTLPNHSLTGAAVAGGLSAYALQSLVSIDQVTLRFSFWVLLAALATATATSPGRPGTTSPSPAARVATVIFALALVGGSFIFGAADLKAQRATGSDLDTGQRLLREALALREEAEYRKLLIRWTAAQALENGNQQILPSMRSALGPLAEAPDPESTLLYGRLLHYARPSDMSVLDESIDALRRSARAAPTYPLIDIEMADALTSRGRVESALEILIPLGSDFPSVGSAYVEYWPVLGYAQLAAGDTESAARTSAIATRQHPNSCQATALRELLRNQTSSYRPDGSTLLTLRIQCDAEYYNLFLHRLPPQSRADYS